MTPKQRLTLKSFSKHWLLVVILFLFAILIGCAYNPYTERSQFLLIPEDYEMDLGAQAYQQVLKDPKNKISKNPIEVEPVQRVAKRIIAAAKQSKYAERAKKFDWEVVVIKNDKVKNAFALPGGKIAFYTGIFPMAKNENGLAAIMGHEVIHALARHGAERMSQKLGAQVVLTGTQIALQGQGVGYSNDIMKALGLGVEVGIILPFSREHESEADYIGLLLAAQAGYDPRESVRVWERMEKAGGQQPVEFMSTHPSHGTRISQLQSWMPEAMRLYEKAAKAPGTADLPEIAK